MGYYNPLLSYGEERILQDAKEAGVNGFIVVDLVSGVHIFKISST